MGMTQLHGTLGNDGGAEKNLLLYKEISSNNQYKWEDCKATMVTWFKCPQSRQVNFLVKKATLDKRMTTLT